MKTVHLLALAVAATLLAAPAHAQRTWNFLTTGNGHGFQIYSANEKKITAFLEHPYRYLRPRPDPKSDGIGRRDLAFDVYFGVRGGGQSGWLNEAPTDGDPSYVQESNVIRAPSQLGAVKAESFFFAPFGYEGNAMVAILKTTGATDGFALFNFHMGAGGSFDEPDANGESLRVHGATQAVIETGPQGTGAMVYVPLSGVDHVDCQDAHGKVKAGQELGDNATCSGNDVVPVFQRKLGADGMMAVAVAFVEDAADADAAAASLKQWAQDRAPQKLLDDTLAEFEAWRKPPPANAICNEAERKLWRQSETVLRMGQVREPYLPNRKNTGMVLASLPPGEWHSGWVRDAMYALVAYARMGHFEEAKAGLDFFLNAGPVGKFSSYVSGVDYRISVVRYFGNGEEEADYSGQPTPNIEIDGWGMFLWAARQYVEASGDTAWLESKTRANEKVWDVLISGVANPLEANLESNGIAKADSGIWEIHLPGKHFAYTTMAMVRGFCDLAAMAAKTNRSAEQTKYQGIAEKGRAAFLSAFVDPNGALAGSIEGLGEGRYKDGAVAEAFTWNILKDVKGATATATLDLLQQLRVESGGFKRNDEGKSSYDNNEWILVDLRIIDSMRRAGRTAEAAGYFDPITTKSAQNFNLIPELYNAVPSDGQIGRYTGSIPMVGYGAGAYVLSLLERGGYIEPNDCGDGMGNTITPSVMCEQVQGDGGVIGDPDGGGGDGGGGGGGGGSIPYEPACLCNIGGPGQVPGVALVLLLAPWALLALRRRR